MQQKMGPTGALPLPEDAMKIMTEAFSFTVVCEEVSLLQACGRVLAEDIAADEYLPMFNRSAMDGYSVYASDIKGASKEHPVTLPLVGEVCMGDAADTPLAQGTCVYTPTGAAVPQGTQSVVKVEDTQKNADGTISFLSEIAADENVIKKGEDVYPGKVILQKGRILNISDIGAIGVLGKTTIKVAQKPKVGIISTGDELVDISEPIKEGQIRDINSTTLALLAQEIGCIPVRYGIVKDEEELLFAKVKEAVDACDMVLISGGSSMGEKDVTEQIVERFGTLILHGIRVKPGKPTIVGNVDGKPVIGVPGNPISAFFITRVFLKNIMLQMMGAKKEEVLVDVTLQKEMKANKNRTQYNFAKLSVQDATVFAQPIKMQSGLMTSIAGCDAFLSTDAGGSGFAAGESVKAQLI